MGTSEQLYVTSTLSIMLVLCNNSPDFLMIAGFMAKPDWRYDFSSCLEDIGSLSTRSKVVVQVEKVKSCCKLL